VAVPLPLCPCMLSSLNNSAMIDAARVSRLRLRSAVLFLLLMLFLFASYVQSDDEFKALPGLWKTTLAGLSPQKQSPLVNWHCVDEGSDPWTNFAYLGAPFDGACKRIYSERTSTSLKWRLDCVGFSTTSETGWISFATADHYTGKVDLHGTFMGYPVAQTISIEGKRYAACTSPQD